MNTYIPQAGTIPAKVIAALSLLEPGAELPSAAVLEAIDQPSDWHGLSACMKMAVDSGAVKKRSDGRLSFWSLPSKCAQPDHPAEAVPAGPARAIAPAGIVLDIKLVDPVLPTTEAEAVRSIAVEAPQPATSSTASKETAPDEFECALTSANRLVLHIDGLDITLCQQRTRVLFRYLDRVRPPECGEAAA